jgi:hypothetical protein
MAQINAATHPINVQPRKRFTRKIPVASDLSLPMSAGRKYRTTANRRPNMLLTPPRALMETGSAALYKEYEDRG